MVNPWIVKNQFRLGQKYQEVEHESKKRIKSIKKVKNCKVKLQNKVKYQKFGHFCSRIFY